MTPAKLIATVGLLSLATFIVILDATIINVAIPHIASSFAASPSEATWVITSYAVAEALTVPLSGWLVERLGSAKLLVLCLLSFATCSALCALSSSLGALIVFRVLQGLSGGPLIPVSQTLIIKVCPPAKLQIAMGLWMITSIIAPIAGPFAGGALADTLGWRWAFYLNVPVAAGCAFAALLLFRGLPKESALLQRMDFQGLFLLCIWVSALQIMLGIGEDNDWFSSELICSLLIAAVLGFFVFLAWELTEVAPVVDLKVFRHRGFSICAAVMFTAFGSFFAGLVLMPLWLQLAMNYTATQAGIVMACQALLGLVAAPVVAGLMDRVDPRALMSVGLLILSTSVLYRSTFATSISFYQIIGPQLFMGLGLPFFFIPIMTHSLTIVPQSQAAAASGIINFVRTIGGAIATAAVVALWNRDTRDVHAQLAMGAHMDSLLGDRPNHGDMVQTIGLIDHSAWLQAQTVSANNMSIGIGVLLAISAFAVWLIPKRPLAALTE